MIVKTSAHIEGKCDLTNPIEDGGNFTHVRTSLRETANGHEVPCPEFLHCLANPFYLVKVSVDNKVHADQ